MNFSDPGQRSNILSVLPRQIREELNVSMRKLQIHGKRLEAFVDIARHTYFGFYQEFAPLHTSGIVRSRMRRYMRTERSRTKRKSSRRRSLWLSRFRPEICHSPASPGFTLQHLVRILLRSSA